MGLFFPSGSSGYYINLVILIHGHLFNSLDFFFGYLFCFVGFVVILQIRPDLIWASSMFSRVSGPHRSMLAVSPL